MDICLCKQHPTLNLINVSPILEEVHVHPLWGGSCSLDFKECDLIYPYIDGMVVDFIIDYFY